MPTHTASPAAVSRAAAPRLAKAAPGRAQRRVQRRRPRLLRPSRLLAWLLAAWLGPVGLSLAQVAPGALLSSTLPTGGQVVVGSGVLQHNPNLLIIQQNSQKLGLDWQSFNIGSGATVEFRQPNAGSVALNRVLGNSGTEIYGQLRANGQVFLTNPNGVLFAPGAKVDVGGLVASTLDLSQQDFADGRYIFNHTGGRGAVVNQGSLTASAGGYLALFGNQVSNQGDISVDAGSVVLAAGRAATVSISGSGLLSAVVTPGALDGRVDNSGRISADGGVVTLTAKSAQDIAASLVNNSGIVRANTLVEKAGEIWITGDRVASSGTLSVAAPQTGDAGHIVVKGDLKTGSLQLDGRIDATAAAGRGGNVETSAAHVAIARDTRVDSRGAAATGTWLIDPTDFTIAAGGGAQTTSGIGADTLATNLASNNITLATAAGGSEPGDIHVNGAVAWSASTTLTLTAARDININASVSATGAGAGLVLTTGTGRFVNVNQTDSLRPTVSLSGVNAALTINNLGYTLVRDLAGLQAMNSGLAGRYALMADIDASSTATNGFVPIGNETSATVTNTGAFTGVFDGLGHSITGLTINRGTSNATALFASTNAATLRNFELVGGAVTGSQYVGAVVGYTRGATTLHNIRSSANVSAVDDGSVGVWAGGLVGLVEGSTAGGVLRSLSSGAVSATSNTSTAYAGGLAAQQNSGLLANVSASGNVSVALATGTNDTSHHAGGLVGHFSGGNVTTASATGNIVGGHESGGLIGRFQPTASSTLTLGTASGNVTGTGNVGGLVGYASGTGAITSSSATGSVSTSVSEAQSFHAGGAVGRYAMTGAPSALSAAGNVSGGNTTGGVVGWIESNVALVAGSLVSAAPGGTPPAPKTVTGPRWVGGLIGYSDSTSAFSGLSSDAVVTATGNQGSVGGLIGRSNGALNSSSSSGSVSGVGSDIGGLVGRAQGTGGMSAVSSAASVTSTGTGGAAGGLVGAYTNSGSIVTASASGAVQGPTGNGGLTGGLIGSYSSAGSLTTVSTAQTSTVTGGGDVGGLIGQATGSGSATINGATVRGTVTGAANTGYVGGLVGQFSLPGGWSNVTVEGAVTGGSGSGGLAGYYSSAAAITTGSYTPASISGGTWVGGVVGYMASTAAISGAAANNPWVIATNVTATNTGGGAGGLAGRTAGVVTNISTTGTVSGADEAGGVVGRAEGGGGLSNLRASGNVSSSAATAAVGGVAGYVTNSGGMNNATAIGNVGGGRYTGGVVGQYSTNGNLQTLRAEGSVSGTGDVGGVVGYASGSGSLSDADALGSVTSSATNTYSAGGAVGYFALSGGLSDITAAGNVSGGTQTGGVIGYYTPTTAIAAGALSYVNSASRSVTGATWVGGLIGYSSASAIGAHSVAAAVTNTGTSGAAGGLAGRTGGSLVNSSASGAVVSAAAAGGLVGQADGTATFTDVSASGAVQGRTEVGGLIGMFTSSATMLRATASGSVFTNSTGGGLVGYHYGGAITDSGATGKVTGLSDSSVYVGGLVGQYGAACYYCTLADGYVISGSQASGSVRADASGSYTGGLVGMLYSGVINNSNASGAVTSRDSVNSNSNEYTGGLVGYFGSYNEQGRITGSNATGAVNGGYYNGGLVGYFNGGAVSNSTASGTVSNGRETGGLMGYAVLYGPMSNVSASGAVISTDSSASGAAGGLLGRVYLYGIGNQTSGGSITNASASGAVTVARTSGEVGGLIGYAASSNNSGVGPINDSRASGNVSGGSNTGGLIGSFDNSGGYSAVLNSSATGSVTGNSIVGGLVGNYARSTTTGRADDITNSFATGRVSGSNYLGGLVGNFDGRYGIVGSHATGDVVARDVTGIKYMGGLVGMYYGRHTSTSVVSAISTSYATGRVQLGSSPVISASTDVYAGGLVGYLNGSIAAANGIVDAYASGAVTLASTLGRLNAGGLVGYAANGQGGLRSYASGVVSATGGNTRATGGLLAARGATTSVFTDSYWNSTTTGQASSLGGGTARTTAEMQQASSFSTWNLATTGAGGTVWRIYDGYTSPLLSRFLTPRTLSLADASKAYDGTRSFGNATLTALNGSINFPDRIFVATPSADVGSYNIAAAGVYSVQNGYDLTVSGSATLSVTPRAITLAGLVADKVYDGTRTATLLGTAQPSGVVAGEALTVNITGATAVFDTKNVGQGKAVTITGLSLADGTTGKASNYALADASASSANVTPATLNAGGFTATSRAYDGSTTVAVSAAGGTVTGIFGADDVSVSLGSVSSGSIADKNVGTAKPVTILGATLSGVDAGNYVIGGLNSTTVDITPRTLTINGLVATNRVYNQGLTVSVPIANGVISGAVSGDVLQLRNVSVTGTMADRHAGDGKAVSVSGSSLQLRGPDAANYTVANATSTVNIARETLYLYADYYGTSNDKVYDGNDLANGTTPYFYSNVTGYLFAGTSSAGQDSLTLSHAAPRYGDKNVAYTGSTVTTKTITVANAVLAGTDAGNYILDNTSATTSGRITPRSLTVSGVSATNRAYDGSVNVNVNVTGATVDTTAVVPGDAITVTVPGTGTVVGTMVNKNVGTAKAVTVPGFSLGGGDAGNYTLSGNAGVTVDISRKDLTAVYTALDKVYDGNAYASMNVASADIVAGDAVQFYANTAQYGCFGCYSFFVTDTSTPASYTLSRDVGTNKRVVVTSNGLFGSDASNYTLLNTTATVTASITPKGITPVFTGVNRVYDGTTTATVNVNTSASGIVSGDAVSLTRNASFADRNAGTGKTVTITDIAFTGAAAANYTLATNTATTTANITPKTLSVAGVTATDRVYDGSTTVALTVGTLGASGLVGNDVVTVNAPGGGISTGTVATKAAALNKAVTVAGLTLSGTDAANYSINGSLGVTVNITPRPLTVSYTGQAREYNGGVSASVTAGSSDIVSGDLLSFTQNAIFSGLDGRNVGTNKPISVTSIVPGGTDSANYALQNTTATTTGSITAKAITVVYTGLSRVYNGLADTSANVAGFSFGRIDGDQISFTQTATFTGNGAAGTGKAVNITNIALAGPQGANYSLINTTATTTASITTRQLGVTGVIAANRAYDGTTTVQLSTQGATVLPSGVLAGDDVAIVLPTGGITTGTMATKDTGSNKPVSITGLTLSGTSAANYSVGGNGLTVSITPRSLTASYAAANRMYDGTTLASVSGSSADILSVDVGALGISASGLFSGGKNAGINKAVVVSGGFLTGAERNNYSLLNATGLTTANITPRDITALYDGGTRVYDGGVNATVTARSTGVLAGDVLSFVQTAVFSGTGAKNVGSGKAISVSGISLNGADAANYQLTSTTASTSGSITPKSISIDGITGVNATNRAYDGSRAVEVVVSTSGSIAPSSADIVAGDAVTINLPAGGITSGTMANKNAGNNKAVVVNGLTLSGTDAPNYVVAATTGVTVNIARKAVTAVYSVADRVYDGSTTATATATSSDLLLGDVVAIGVNGVFTGIGARNAGSNKPVSLLNGRLSGSDAANYALINTTDNTTANITPKEITPSYTGLDKVYDGTTTALATAATGSIISGDAVQFSQTAAFTGNKNVGNNKEIAVSGIVLSGSDATNYILTTDTASTSGNITPRPLRIDGITSVTATDRVYDGTGIVSVVVSSSGPIAPNPQDLIAGDVVTVNALTTTATTGTMLDKNVGSAKPVAVAGLDLAGADAINYGIAATSGVTVNITPRPLTAVYTAAAREYDGTSAASLFGSSTDIISGDVLSITGSGVFSGPGAKNVGTGKLIAITSVSFSGADMANYSLLNPSGTATGSITPRSLTVSYLGGSRVYDGQVAAPVTGTADRFVAGDDIRLVQTAVFTGLGAKNVGIDKAVAISAIGLAGSDAANYSVNIGSATTTATVTQRPLRIDGFTGVVASDRVYDGTVTVAITATGSGSISAHPDDLIAGDDITVVPPTTGTTAGTMADKNVGSNKPVVVNGLRLSGADANNYMVAAASGVTVNITPKPLTAVYTAAYAGLSRVYDGTAVVAISGNSADIAGFDLVTITGSGLFTGADAKNAGTNKAFSITGGSLGGADALNYSLQNPTGTATATVTPKILVADYTGGTRVYDGSNTAPVTGVLQGVIDGDSLSFSQTAVFTGSAARNVGEGKLVQVSGITLAGSDAVNYGLLETTVNTTATVTPRPLNIGGLSGLQAVNRVYDGTNVVEVTGNLVIGTTTFDLVPGDDVSIILPSGSVSAGLMLDKAVGTAKGVVVAGLSLNGNDAANYQIVGTAGLSVNIAPRPVVLLGVSAQDRVYDGSTVVAIDSASGSLSGVLAGDDLQLRSSGVTGTMADKNVGSGKAVTVSGLSFEGADLGNYTVSGAGSGLTVNITPRTLLSSVVAADKVYDGNVNAAVTLGSNAIVGDSVSLTAASALFASANAGSGLGVAVSGLTVAGADAGNYSFTPGTLTTTASIQRRPLTVAANTLSKIYGETLSLTSSNFSIEGLVQGESLGTVVLASAGTGAAANAGSYTLSVGGASGGSFNPDNYVLAYVNGSLTVTPRPLTIAANSVVRFADQQNPTSFGYSTSVGGLTVGDSLASVLVSAPAASVGAPAISVFDLLPTGAVFASGTASNYAITYGRGVLLVLPTPPRVDDVNAGGEPTGNTGFAVQVDPAEVARALGALTRNANVVAQARAEDSTPDTTALPASREATAAAVALLLSGDGGRITLPDLQRLPLISFEPGLRRLLTGAPAPAAAPSSNRPAP